MTARTRTFAALVLIVLAGAWAHAPGLAGVFVFDDLPAIARNPHLRSLSPISRAMTAPADTTLAGRPIATLTFAINYALAPADARETFAVGIAAPAGAGDLLRRNVFGYHLVNLAIHLAAAVVLFGIVRRTLPALEAAPPASVPRAAGAAKRRATAALPSGAPDARAAATWTAAAIAVLWVVHPLTTSAVTYVVQRVESLAGLWYLLTLYFAIRAWETVATPRFWRWAAAGVAACALGMATKEVMVTAPLAVVGWWWLFGAAAVSGGEGARPAKPRRQPRRWWGFVAALGATWVILAALVAAAPRSQSVGWTIAGWTPSIYLLTQAEVVLHYVRLAVWPAPLLADYGWTPVRSIAEVVLPFTVLSAAVAAAAVGVWRRRTWAFPLALIFLLLAPTSSLLPIGSEIAAEHRMYLPVASILTLAVVAIGRLTGSAAAKSPAAVIVVALLTVVLGLVSRDRGRDYWSQDALWRHDIAHQPDYARPRVSYGMALFAAGQYADAEMQFRAAAALDPRDVLARVNLGAVLCARGQLDQGISELEQALAIDPAHPDGLATLGDAYTARGDDARAVPWLVRALEARPTDVIRLNRLGWLLATSADATVRDPARALDLGARAVALTNGADVMSLNTLAAAQAAAGRSADAVATMTTAIAVATRQGLADTIPELDRRRAAYAAGR